MGHLASKPVAHRQQQTTTTFEGAIKQTTFQPKKYLSRIEIVCLEQSFHKLKSTFKDHYECIELKNFLKHLNLPIEIEPAAILLYKSFSYLGSYPACATVGPVPLSFEAFLTAFVVLTGRLDQIHHNNLSETLFFQSLSILPTVNEKELKEPEDNTDIKPTNKQTGGTIEATSTFGPKSLTKGLSLADLGIDFDDLNIDSSPQENETVKEKDTEGASEILCKDLIDLFVCFIWLGEADKQEQHDFHKIRRLATDIVVKSISLPYVTYEALHAWIMNFSPHFFKLLQSLIIHSFTYNNSSGNRNAGSRLLIEDKLPSVDKTDILTPLYITLLSWTLPEQILISKKWLRLYSAEEDGFSMNRLESHVFKYPGPTLMIMEIDEKEPLRRRTKGKKQELTPPRVIGAFIKQPWKHSKHLWGDKECFLFELDPSFDIFRPVKNHSHCNDDDHYILYHHDFGIGFGPTGNQQTSFKQYYPARDINKKQQQQQSDFILTLNSTLQEGIYKNEPYPEHPTFESANRKQQEFCFEFQIENIEVFGLGCEKDREKQAREWKFEKQEAARRASLNIRQADGQLDKELLKMAGIIDEDKRQDR
ncbi:TLD-domain-containing protein [Mycotypha africana]|uniref:TLD-domain-containing protein n=1 Tax=Mycotypha africana TaxID=64632 RepID=UPI002301A1E1|nr:TLD-domain-containing protein [Mycotypha africana]KAI8968160.1 TLD-domain-containing protein [Mycotypha africana]